MDDDLKKPFATNLSAKERAEVVAAAERCGLKPAPWLRMVALQAARAGKS